MTDTYGDKDEKKVIGGDFDDHSWVLERLKDMQEADHDNRERSRESHNFIEKRDGQWEEYWWNVNDGKPRYTFDMVTPIIDQIMADIRRADFDISVIPEGSDASKDTAKTYDGLIRNIEEISNADVVYDQSSEEMVVGGFSALRVCQKYVEGDSFDQDLIIEHIGNAVDRVWLGPHERPDGSDAKYAVILTGLSKADFKKRFPDAPEESVDQGRAAHSYYHREDLMVVGELLYLQEEARELALLSNGQVMVVDDAFTALQDELEAAGILVESTRTRIVKKCYSRLFGVSGWLSKPRETVFENWVPVVPLYGNFRYIEDKVVYQGAVDKLIDPQRVMNYSLSREIEEGALAPRAKYWMTEQQAEGYEADLARMNVSPDPIQLYNPDERVPGPPQQQGGAQINPGLRTISEAMRAMIGMSAGMFAANMGDNPGLQSGKAIEALQDKGEAGNNKYLVARERAQAHLARILVDAIPRIYTPGRQIRVLSPDGSYEMQTIGQKVMDEETGQSYVLNDVSNGIYSVRCTSGPAFKTRQSETVAAITEIGKVDPSVIEMGGDVLLSNIPAPGMDEIAARKRQLLFKMGAIPPEQMTDEEKMLFKQMQQQPPKETPEMVLAKAEQAKAQSDLIDSETKKLVESKTLELKLMELRVKEFEAQTDRFKAEIERAKAGAEVQGKTAAAAKHLAEAEAQDIENDAVKTGLMDLANKVGGYTPPKEAPSESSGSSE